MKVLLSGDTHGKFIDIADKIDIAKDLGGIDRMVVLGDFGLWNRYGGVAFLDDVNEYARENNFYVFALPGNHENHPWWNSIVQQAYINGQTSRGFAYVRTNVLLSPRVHKWTWGKKQFVITGGAVSIDKQYRLEYERQTGNKIWWADEQTTDEEVDAVIDWDLSHVDYFLTHDCSNRTPWGSRLKPDIDSHINRQRIDKILKHLQPGMHFHGHMHERYDWLNQTAPDAYTQTYGLECNSDYYSWGVLDTATDEFYWPDDLGVVLNNNRPVLQ